MDRFACLGTTMAIPGVVVRVRGFVANSNQSNYLLPQARLRRAECEKRSNHNFEDEYPVAMNLACKPDA